MALDDENPPKRTTNPGVRVVGGRIYDSSNGKTCHQCRQKTMDLVASCKGMKKDKQCRINYCHKCLSNRYGEKAEEVVNIDDWICPKCRGNCNCSFCRKKRGQNPTGILAHRAKASGLSSVSELLEVEGSDNFAFQRKTKPEYVCIEGSSSGNNDVGLIDVVKEKNKMASKNKKDKATKKPKEETLFEAQLPEGISLYTFFSGLDVPIADHGDVFQFLEFCSTFGKAIDFNEGQAESVVAELFSCEGNTKRLQDCSIVSMMIQLLTLISDDRDMSLSLNATDSSWFTAVGEFLLQSGVLRDVFPPETFKSGVSEYEKMDSSRRLKLLNFLCDESLSTWAMRYFIENYRKKSEKKKREEAEAAKEKEKQMKQEMQVDLVQAHMENNGASLAIEEHNAMLSQIRAEAHEEMMEAKGMTSKYRQRCDAVRTEPILLNDNGLVLWKLKCFQDEPQFLLQDVGTFDDSSPHEYWFTFKPEQRQDLENYISQTMIKQKRAKKESKCGD